MKKKITVILYLRAEDGSYLHRMRSNKTWFWISSKKTSQQLIWDLAEEAPLKTVITNIQIFK